MTEAPELILNLSSWIERRKQAVGPYADHIIHTVSKYEAEIERLRAVSADLPAAVTPANALAALERCILRELAAPNASFGITHTYYSLGVFESEIITRDMARALLRGLADRGFCRYRSGLFTEEGRPAGSGYGITQSGIDRLRELDEAATTQPDPVKDAARELLAAYPNPIFDRLKPLLMGEFAVPLPVIDENGDEGIRNVNVPWVVIKDVIRAALRALAEQPKENG